MKKLLVVLAVAAIAVSAQASKVTWGAGTAAAFDFTKIGSGTMYLLTASDATKVDFSKLADMTEFTEAGMAAAGLDMKFDTLTGFSSSNYKKSNSVFTPATLGYDPGTYASYAVVIADDGKTVAYSSTAQSISLAAASAVGQTKSSAAFTYVTAKTPGPTPTPEPTSGLLLVLGMAGLALRRRRA